VLASLGNGHDAGAASSAAGGDGSALPAARAAYRQWLGVHQPDPLYAWCRQHGIRFTRGRGYRKNDQAYVEQRNWLGVRRSVGYDRYNSQAAFQALQRLYPLLRLQLNFLRPVRKLVGKRRCGARVSKLYDAPRTPYQRLLESGILDDTARKRLDKELRAINPADLQRKIESSLRRLWDCTERKERRKVG